MHLGVVLPGQGVAPGADDQPKGGYFHAGPASGGVAANASVLLDVSLHDCPRATRATTGLMGFSGWKWIAPVGIFRKWNGCKPTTPV
ncbi:hypothetical protein BO71DRAFT_401600 [Aspergillus ellipticus CBS 707.79]|uniref:Uncharacterized protein n=1 Tax=Aspergillus ellipticus CBS 707.79 TaxID=1448320 RepID=A0A319D1M1_9EURO|nr:hypothetical protein BO71DRAFT_401600 [Aspergillus ellipticus CBS 707.79]